MEAIRILVLENATTHSFTHSHTNDSGEFSIEYIEEGDQAKVK